MGPFESTHDEWLAEAGLTEKHLTAVAVKRDVVARIRELMTTHHIDAHLLSERMQTSRAAVDRLLDPENDVVSLRALYRAARELNSHLRVEIV